MQKPIEFIGTIRYSPGDGQCQVGDYCEILVPGVRDYDPMLALLKSRGLLKSGTKVHVTLTPISEAEEGGEKAGN